MDEEISSLLTLAKRISEPPPCYERRGSLFWAHPWSSRKALEVQLDPHRIEGARSREVAQGQVAEIVKLLGRRPEGLLDLGCGPGYHLTSFAALGARVEGIDVSPAAVEQAKAERRAEPPEISRRITIREGEMLASSWGHGAYDLVLLLFGELCLLTAEERALFFRKAKDALAPGGTLLLELFWQPTEEVLQEQSWEYVEGEGFWSPGPYLELNATSVYPEEQVVLHRFLLLREGEEPREERIWESSMDEERLRAEAEAAGLRLRKVIWDHPLFDGGGVEEGRRWFVALLAAGGS